MKTNLKKIKLKKGWWKRLLITILCLGLVAGAGFEIASVLIPGKVDDFIMYTSLPITKFGIGGLDSNGKFKETDSSIFTVDLFECQGINTELSLENNINYSLYFYDHDGQFLYRITNLSTNFSNTISPFAKYARVVIDPREDDTVSLFEVFKYAKQLKISVYREQSFKNYSNNLITSWTVSSLVNADGTVTTNSGWDVSSYINVSEYEMGLVVKVADSLLTSGQVNLATYDSNKNFIELLQVFSFAKKSFHGSTFYYLDFSSFDTIPSYIRLNVYHQYRSDIQFLAC